MPVCAAGGAGRILRGTLDAEEEAPQQMSALLSVHNPMGYPPKVTAKPMAPRIDTLDGKTVALVDCRFDDSDVFLKQMQAWFGENMPNVKTRFIQIRNVYTKDDPETWQEVKETCDAAIIGVGH
jgi:hypothetical protein